MNRSLLLVEDNDQDEVLIMRILGKVDLAKWVEVVRDGQQALDYLLGSGEFAHRKNAELPEVVLLDINLPRINGIEVLRRLRADQRTRLLPVVMLTSSDDQHDRQAAYLGGANSYVYKALDFAGLTEALTHIGQYWLFINKVAHLNK